MTLHRTLILALLMAAGCTYNTPVEQAPCPCLDGYVCCEAIGICLAPGTQCPTAPPPLSCELETATDGSADIVCSDGSRFEAIVAEPACGDRDGRLVFHDDVVIRSIDDAKAFARYQNIDGDVTIDLQGVSAPRTIRLPCLERAHDLQLSTNNGSTTIELPALTQATGLQVAGEYSEVALPRLQRVDGDLTIEGSGFSDLRDLSALRIVDGRLVIRRNRTLQSLAGLSATTTITGDIEIDDNDGLTTLDGLGARATVLGSLYLGGNSRLATLRALAGLTTIRGDLTVEYNDALPSLEGLGALQVVEGNLRMSNNGFTSLTGLEALVHVGGSVELRDPQLTSLRGLDCLASIGESLYLEQGRYTDLSSLGALATIGSDLRIASTPLTGLEGLHAGVQIGRSMTILDNPVLTSLSALHVTAPPGVMVDVTIEDNPRLATLDGPTGLADIGRLAISTNPQMTAIGPIATSVRTLEIRGNDALTDLDGLSGLTAVGSVAIVGNPRLASVAALAGAAPVEGAFGGVEVGGNALTSLAGLQLRTGGDLSIQGEPLLASLSGLVVPPELGSITVSGNAALTSLGGLEPVRSANFVSIGGNGALTSIAALGGLERATTFAVGQNAALTELGVRSLGDVESSLDIVDNACLPQCVAIALRDVLEAGMSRLPHVEVRGNRGDCTCSAQDGEVVAMCMPGGC